MAGTQSVLDAMTSGVMERKAQAKTVLTPVGREATQPLIGGPLDQVPGAPFPWDSPTQSILQAIAQIRSELAFIEAGLGLVESTLGVGAATITTPKPTEPARLATAEIVSGQKERLAAAKKVVQDAIFDAAADGTVFRADFAAKAAAAQAEAFTPVGWNCPDHGKFVTKTSRLGREYRACPICKEFEKPS